MKLYNTLTRKVEEFRPQNPPKVSFYSCGPTVYDYPHIGNWYTFIRYDLLYRMLRASGYDTSWVMNITDVGHLTSDADEGEDKLEKGAKREGATAWDIAKKYTEYFEQALNKLNISSPLKLPKATDHIQEQIDLISRLENNGNTYIIDDGVYFDTSTFKHYGDFAQLDLENLKEGARVEVNDQKRNPADFALWKFSLPDSTRDMEWDSPWGKGFPGWHIECSAMSMKYLGETLDIHAGGIDHIPVHHTNEIAQSESATGKQFANFWVHMNFVLVDNRKMSKSDGTFITLEDIQEKGFSLEAFRLMVLQSHYRTEAHFSWENLQAAQNRLNNYYAMADLLWQPVEIDTWLNHDTSVDSLKNALFDDLDTPLALRFLSGFSAKMEENLLSSHDVDVFKKILNNIDSLLGLRLSERKDIAQEAKQVLAQRNEARTAKNWALADSLRDQLSKDFGITVRDTAYGQIWSQI